MVSMVWSCAFMILRLFARASSSQACITVDHCGSRWHDWTQQVPSHSGDLFRTKSHIGQEVPDKEWASKDQEHDTRCWNDLESGNSGSVAPCIPYLMHLSWSIIFRAKSGRLSWIAAPDMDPEGPSAIQNQLEMLQYI